MLAVDTALMVAPFKAATGLLLEPTIAEEETEAVVVGWETAGGGRVDELMITIDVVGNAYKEVELVV